MVNNGAASVPIAMGDGTALAQALPFANALTQAQVQTQAGMNPLILAMLNGLTGLPTVTGNLPAVPNLGEAAATQNPIPTEPAIPGQETTPENANITLLAMAALCLNPMQTVSESIAPQMLNQPVQTDTVATQAAPVTTAVAGQAIPQITAEEMAAFVAQMQVGQTTKASVITPSTGQKSAEDAPPPIPATALLLVPEQKQTDATANSPQPLPVPTLPATLLEAQAKLGVNIKTVQGQQAETVKNVSQNPIQLAQTESVPVHPTMAAIVSAEPNTLTITQGAAKKIAALPMNTERAIVLPTFVLPTAAGSPSSEAETSDRKGEKAAEQAIANVEIKSQDKAANTHAVQPFGATLNRVENAGQTTGTQTEAVKPQAADRYEVTAQVTKHLETMTAAGGRSELVLQLKPEHLGQVKITLSNSENGLSAKISMDSVQAHQAMIDARETLRSAFEQRGINLESLDVSLNQQAFGNGQQTFAGMQMGHSHSQAFGARHNSAAQTAFAGDEAEIPLLVTGQNAASGLNRLDFRA